MMNAPRKIVQLDYIRAVAIVFIVLLHVSDKNGTADIHSAAWFFTSSIQSLVRVGLPLFFILSGYLLLRKYDNIHDALFFYKKRVIRILPLFLLWSLIYYCVKHHDGFSIVSFIEAVLSGPTWGHLWFVYTLLGIYLTTPILGTVLSQLSNKTAAVLILGTLVFNNIAFFADQLGVDAEFFGYMPKIWMGYFMMGYLARLFEETDNGHRMKYLYLSLPLLYLATFVMIPYRYDGGTPIFGPLHLAPYDMSVTMPLFAFCLFMAIRKLPVHSNRLIEFLSSKSFNIYFSHILFVKIYDRTIFINNIYMDIILEFLFVLSLSLILAYLSDAAWRYIKVATKTHTFRIRQAPSE